jgi:membrane protease YdiL (CAAX protease family)
MKRFAEWLAVVVAVLAVKHWRCDRLVRVAIQRGSRSFLHTDVCRRRRGLQVPRRRSAGSNRPVQPCMTSPCNSWLPWIPRRIGLAESCILFAAPALLLWASTHFLIPPLIGGGWAPQLAWFAAGSLVFLPLLLAAVVGAALACGTMRWQSMRSELRLRALSREDVRLAAKTIALTTAATAVIYGIAASLVPDLPLYPPFLGAPDGKRVSAVILISWLPFFFLNIVGEELWWRGFIQPRQEPVFGRSTWILQGAMHAGFHISFGWGLLILLLPTVFAIAWAVQRSQNTSVGIAVHGTINGAAFLAINFGGLST